MPPTPFSIRRFPSRCVSPGPASIPSSPPPVLSHLSRRLRCPSSTLVPHGPPGCRCCLPGPPSPLSSPWSSLDAPVTTQSSSIRLISPIPPTHLVVPPDLALASCGVPVPPSIPRHHPSALRAHLRLPRPSYPSSSFPMSRPQNHPMLTAALVLPSPHVTRPRPRRRPRLAGGGAAATTMYVHGDEWEGYPSRDPARRVPRLRLHRLGLAVSSWWTEHGGLSTCPQRNANASPSRPQLSLHVGIECHRSFVQYPTKSFVASHHVTVTP